MNTENLKAAWLREEREPFSGWDFQHLDGLCESDPLPWDYEALARRFLKSSTRLLDIGTGGGEFLLSLGHPSRLTAATEGYPPNIALCRERLLPLGVDFRPGEKDVLPFAESTFDLVLNRHADFAPQEVFRVLKPGGLFLTQQVGGKNNNDLSRRLLPDFSPPYPGHTLLHNLELARWAGLEVLESGESFPQKRFFTVEALVYFAKVIQWEFPGFSVESCFDRLLECQREQKTAGFITATEHRFYLVARRENEV